MRRWATVLMLLFAVSSLWPKTSGMELSDSCLKAQRNTRIIDTVLESVIVHRAFQCEDRCFRNELCNAFNFLDQRFAGSANNCELVEATSSGILRAAENWVFSKMNRTEMRSKLFGSGCQLHCGERHKCNRDIYECGFSRCVCKDAFLDEGSGTCPLKGCSGQGLLKGTAGQIGPPAEMSALCSGFSALVDPAGYTCYHQIIQPGIKNIILRFTKFKLNGGSPSSCGSAAQFLEVDAGKSPQRFCGDHGEDYLHLNITANKITLKFFFSQYSNTCVDLVGQYTVN